MRLADIMEGGWASESTQDTVITPQTIADAIPVMKKFETILNKHLTKDSLPPIKIGNPVGSGTYYKRDLKQNPDKEYGDIDVQFIMPRGEDSDNKTKSAYFKSIKEFCEKNKDYETTNGMNVIFKIGKDFIQVDLVAIFDDRLDFTKALAPEHGTKGVLSGSLFSALAQALDISISDSGVQGKTVDGVLVSYRKSKGTTLNLISTDHRNWALDVAKFLGAKKISSMLKKHPGMKEEVKIKDIIDSFKGIAETLELNDKIKSARKLLDEVKSIYLKKIEAVASSSKFEKAKSKEMKAKAVKTQKMLRDRSKEIAGLF